MIAILFEDGEALVVDKPGGLPMDRPRAGGRSLADELDGLRLGFQREPAPVHRLDTDTSGCLLLARNPKALKRFAAAFEARLPTKRYLGVMAGIPQANEGTVELALSKISSPAPDQIPLDALAAARRSRGRLLHLGRYGRDVA